MTESIHSAGSPDFTAMVREALAPPEAPTEYPLFYAVFDRPGTPQDASELRHYLCQQAGIHPMHPAAECFSEVTTNALLHNNFWGASATVTESSVILRVYDDDQPPRTVCFERDETEEGIPTKGRGLGLVKINSLQHGRVRIPEDAEQPELRGKWMTWVECSLSEPDFDDERLAGAYQLDPSLLEGL